MNKTLSIGSFLQRILEVYTGRLVDKNTRELGARMGETRQKLYKKK